MVALSGRTRVTLQATFVPAENAFAWWGPDRLDRAVAAHDLPPGRPGTCMLAVPDGARIVAAEREVRLVDVDEAVAALTALDRRSRVGRSIKTWQEAACLVDPAAEPTANRPADRDDEFAALAARMPTAAHAVTDEDGSAVAAPAALLAQFRRAASTTAELTGAVDAQLRPYQVHGVAWLRSRIELGAGGVLADEMGLGKTLQAICLLAMRRTERPHLVVCPTSLIGNWRRELARFSPGTTVVRYHGSSRRLPDDFEPGTVVVTSYPVLRSDEKLAATAWDVVVMDEAQQIKNPEAQVSRAAAKLTATVRIAMTGTPVENRLDELWALFHVTNPGLLGSRSRFRQRFAAPIEKRRSAPAAEALSSLVRPNMLRRTKDLVATELPAKQHTSMVCTLTEEQVRLYREAVDRAFTEGLGGGIGRSGKVLALLTALKQICNHPAQYLGDGPAGSGRSGKFDRATEMLAEIADDGDRALVFTQYRTMGELLSTTLGETLGIAPVPFLHGGLSGDRRDQMVRAFQEDDDAPPVLLLSLRAAGFGLNLTRAAHVMHYDRWWNPAVEAQATDRAHRIGQTRTLNVYTMITGGTIEDRIAQMHDTKRGLADVVDGNAEAALAKLSDDDLHAVLDLDLGAI
ncbi:DEAD/DEAH box helicase [Tsukamurella sp. 8F]|uniref:DEAD/DEAH box helicase n=1 Tax=unclassified Tsukamurella TaxID=2633480 RepID=UPI0023B8E552|nr:MULTISPECIES: DEAD/DEAH box helicase [unclassified Tsukamurella]MDF0529330.1 DEAD/DEAH box helicase [Tsukamurella sp. 8J]MDF0587163.1 DEAD/DEAH box helicase [Tsukamurella sp. 8F]